MRFRKQAIKDGYRTLDDVPISSEPSVEWNCVPGGDLQDLEQLVSSFLRNLPEICEWYLCRMLAYPCTFTIVSQNLQIQTEGISYRRSSSIRSLPSTDSMIRSKWMKRRLHSPNSKSCIKSTTNMSKTLRPSGDSRSENAFWCCYEWEFYILHGHLLSLAPEIGP